MTSLSKPVTRRAVNELCGQFGPDRNRRLVVTLIPATATAPDMLELRPEGTRRAELVALVDIYRFAIRSRVNLEVLTKARDRKLKKQAQREARSIARADAKIRMEARNNL